MDVEFITDEHLEVDLGEIAGSGSGGGTTVISVKANYNQTNPNADDYIIGRENIAGKADIASATEEALRQAKESGEFDGADGVSCTHKWNGTTLTVTSASGTTSANLKGEKGDPYTLTSSDKASIVSDVINALPTWEGGSY